MITVTATATREMTEDETVSQRQTGMEKLKSLEKDGCIFIWNSLETCAME